MPTWRTGLVYKPLQAGSIYVSAGTSFNPSAEMLSLSAATANLPPEKNRTIEAGTKWDTMRSRLSLTAAIFSTGKMNAREPDPTNPLIDVLAGKSTRQRRTGGNPGPHHQAAGTLLTSYAYLDGEVVSSTLLPGSHRSPTSGPERSARHVQLLDNLRRLPRNWGRDPGAGGNYRIQPDRQFRPRRGRSNVTGLVKEVPGYWVFNAMAEHRLSEHVRLQGNVYNIANRYYYDQLHPSHIVLGAGRSALIGLKFNF